MMNALRGCVRILQKNSTTNTRMVGGSGAALCAWQWQQPSRCHGSHHHDDGPIKAHIEQLERRLAALESKQGVSRTTGQGDAVFSWDESLTAAFPEEALPFEKHLHGGFNEDAATGKVYTGVPGAGLYEISADLKSWRRIGDDPRLKDNIHGIVVFEHNGRTAIAAAQNDAQRVLIIETDGTVQQELTAPRGGEFDCDAVNAYYSERRGQKEKLFSCTDVTFLDGKLFVVTGYCQGDFVLALEHSEHRGWHWGSTAWGGKGTGAGQFQTAHGITAYDGHLYVANREAFQVVKFDPTGRLVEVLPDIPHGSRICNAARAEHQQYFVLTCLAPLISTANKTAPIYAHTGEQLISTIDPGCLGIPVLKHVHHVWPHYVGSQLYLLVHGWRDGKFAVLKHEPGH